MLQYLGFASMEEFVSSVVPASIRSKGKLKLSRFERALSEQEMLTRLRSMAEKNEVYRSYMGMGYYGTITPPVILRNVLENPGWYTQYTPYQPEISQGRLEALLNYQTMIGDLTGLPIANASLLDEGTAAAEAMALCREAVDRPEAKTFLVSESCFPQTIEVVRTRAEALGLRVVIGDVSHLPINEEVFGVLLQYPTSTGEVVDYRALITRIHDAGALAVMAADILSLCLLTSPGELGADIAVGSTQRFGIPMGFGGPHAAYFATLDKYKRQIPGRIVGVSRDAAGRPALRLSLQTREQHIRREKATSNICTAQVLLANMAGMYAVFHGAAGLKKIALEVNKKARVIAEKGKELGLELLHSHFFDTVTFKGSVDQIEAIRARAEGAKINLTIKDNLVTIATDEGMSCCDLRDVVQVLGGDVTREEVMSFQGETIPADLIRRSEYLTHEVFNRYHSETEFLRYIKKLESRDLSLAVSMIPLGSCTMKLNATSEMLPVSWKEFSSLHPFAPLQQSEGYLALFDELETALAEITGFNKVSLQPNAGSQGEYAGLLVIRAYQKASRQDHRTICLIPKSAHGTNPASAVMAGLEVVVVDCDSNGNVDIADLRAKAEKYKDTLSCLMVTYPSTHGVFEEGIREITSIIHEAGGQVYMDGANLNALVGLVTPVELGMDVCHINLHKTFCIPHGGGGPGMGPIGVAAHLAPYLPGHPVLANAPEAIGPISAAPWGSASILPISWAYIAMMGAEGLKAATEIAILNANYVAKRLGDHYPVVYKGDKGFVAHECIVDLRPLKKSAGIEVDDVAKRLMDYGFHAPTVSWPVAGTMMIEPTESESKYELDRFCDALISIRDEVRQIEEGRMDPKNNPLKNAPHTAADVMSDSWDRPYGREVAAFPAAWTRDNKFWPAAGRIDASYGDRNLVCSCLPMDAYMQK